MITNIEHRILSFDPGETTGISFVENGYFQMGITVKAYIFQKDYFLSGLIGLTRPTLIVIETPPEAGRFRLSDHIELYVHLKKWFQNAGFPVKTLKPGQWKKLIDRSTIPSSHVRDATDMARFVYREINNG